MEKSSVRPTQPAWVRQKSLQLGRTKSKSEDWFSFLNYDYFYHHRNHRNQEKERNNLCGRHTLLKLNKPRLIMHQKWECRIHCFIIIRYYRSILWNYFHFDKAFLRKDVAFLRRVHCTINTQHNVPKERNNMHHMTGHCIYVYYG